MATITESQSNSASATTATYDRVKASYSFRAENNIDLELKKRIAIALGYDKEDFAWIPEDSNIGEGCGNPLAIAGLKEGDQVVDLGSGGGFDAFLASRKVGPNGKVIGVDMTEKMIDLGRRNAIKMGVSNVTFVHSKINSVPLENDSIDCVISNCVLNLVPEKDKASVFTEIHRILKPGGRIAVSDFLALKPFPPEMKNDADLLAGCVSGAIEVQLMEKLLVESGFDDVLLVDTKKDMSLYQAGEGSKSVTPCCAGGGNSCGSEVTASGRKKLDYDLNEWISSFEIYAHKSYDKTNPSKPVVIARAASTNEQSIAPAKSCAGRTGCCGKAS